ncbi:E3 ubiquitin-protein ligase At1g12760-like, partial [Papaver somniferum]
MLQMERSDNRDADHIISIERRSNASSPSPDRHQDEEGASSSIELSVPQSSLASSNGANSRNSSFARRREGYGRRFSNGRWILIELVFTLSQIIASAIVLSLSRHVKPQVSLSAWVIGHASACVATLPLLYWRFLHRNQGTEQDSTQARQDAPRNNPAPEPSPFAATSVLRATDEEDSQAAVSSARNAESVGISARVNVLVDQFTIASHFFFVVWLFVGNIWILGFNGHSSSAEEPSLYRLSRFFLKICSIWYPFVYAICCCLPCTDFLGFHEDANHIRGAAAENINVLPTYGRSRGGWWDTNGDD